MKKKTTIHAVKHKNGILLKPHQPRRMGWRLADHKGMEFERHDKVHLYFTSEEIPKKGDWMLAIDGQVDKCEESTDWRAYGWKRIIASTDISLGLPTPDKEFIDAYCKEEGIDEVLIEYEYLPGNRLKDDQLEIKVNENKEIIIYRIKTSWTTEELIEKLKSYREYAWVYGTASKDLDKWCDKNL